MSQANFKIGGRSLFHLLGAGVVLFWLVMVAILVGKVNFSGPKAIQAASEHGQSIENAERNWKEIYLKGKKVGYAADLIKPFGEDFFIHEEIFLKLKLMGLGNTVSMITQARVDKGFQLKSFHFTTRSGVVSFDMSGRVENNFLLIESGKGRDRKTRRIRLQGVPLIGPAMNHYFRFRKLQVGDIYSIPLFDPSTMMQKEITVRVMAKETLRINNIPYDTFRLETEMWGKKIVSWVDESGRSLKEEGFMGLTTIKSTPARAPEDLDGETGVDLYDLAAVQPNKKLPDPETLRHLKLRLSGLEGEPVSLDSVDGGRQKYREGILEINKEATPSSPPFSLHRDNFDGEPGSFLGPEFNIESDDPEIIEQVRLLANDHKNPNVVAKRLLDWVYHNLEKRPVLSLPSAKEVLRTRVGDCNEHATLLTALLRAAGIPARLCIGLVYTLEKFYYHAWTEAYLGEWITMDATLNQMPADVTHIKMIEGNLQEQARIAGLIGTLKIEILDYDK